MKKTLLAVTATLALAGCGTPRVQQVSGPVVDGTASVAYNQRVDGIVIGQTIQIKDADGLIRAQTTVQNTNRSRATLNYKYEWFDGAGMQLPSTTKGWQQIQLEAKEDKRILEVSPSSEAKTVKIKVQKN